MTIRVLIADDQAMVREGFTVLLDAQPGIEVVGGAVDGRDAIEQAARLAPDVVLMDVRMPGLGGLEATRIICAGPSPPRILIVTTFDLDEYVYESLRAGASGFILKTATARELAEAVQVVAAGEALLAPSVTRRLIGEFARMGPAAPTAVRIENLTEREQEVLRLVARGLSNSEIAEALVVSDQTVKTHVSRLLTKLGLRDRTQAAIFAYETGLVRPNAPPGQG